MQNDFEGFLTAYGKDILESYKKQTGNADLSAEECLRRIFAEKKRPHSLKAMLRYASTEHLLALGRDVFGKDFPKGTDKSQVESALYEAFLKDETVETLLLCALYSPANRLVTILISNRPALISKGYAHCGILLALGALFFVSIWTDENGDLKAQMPKVFSRRLRELVNITSLDAAEFLVAIGGAANAAVNLYGLIPLDAFHSLLDTYGITQELDTDAELLELLQGLAKNGGVQFDVKGGCLVNTELLAEDLKDVYALCYRRQSELPRKILTKDTFLSYEEWSYTDIAGHWEKLPGLLVAIAPHLDEEQAQSICRDLMFMVRVSRFEYAIPWLSEIGVNPSADEALDLFMLLKTARNNTRIWENNGHTPNELESILK